MNKKYSMLFLGIGLSVIIAVVMFLGFSDNDGMVLEQDNVLQYIPSNITKANPLIIHGTEDNIWSTLNIEDVKDNVDYTLSGTVVSIGDNIVDWDNDEVMLHVDNGKNILVPQIYGFIPITITVQDVYKGNHIDKNFTFYLQSVKEHNSDKYELFSHAPDFEINDDIVIHLLKVDDGPFENGFYLPIFGKHSTYTADHKSFQFIVLAKY